MPTDASVVDNRVFLLGLDRLYRDAVKPHERGELLACARRVAAQLRVAPAEVPVEGYYVEDTQLTEYFRLVRALQEVDESRTPEVASSTEFRRLLDVTAAPLYGRPEQKGKILPVGRDPLAQALLDTRPWTVDLLTTAAHAAAHSTDDISLVGLAARIEDPVVITAARESVVLYAEIVTGAFPRLRPKYVWKVDPELARHANRFLAAFSALFGERLPPPEPAQAERYWNACEGNEILGRCARLGYEVGRSYHWAICRDDARGLVVQDFWHPDVWTTTRYRSALRFGGRCPEPASLAGP